MPQPHELTNPESIIKLKPAQQTELANEIHLLVDQHRADTREFLRFLVVQRRLYELKSRRKTWPWPGAANFIIPIVRFVVDHYKALIQQAYRQSESIWQGRVIGTKERDDEASREEGLKWQRIAENAAKVAEFVSKDPSHINIHEFNDNEADSTSKDGTALVKVHYVSNTQRRFTGNPRGAGRGPVIIEEPVNERVAWDVIDIERCVWTIGGTNPDDMPLIGHWSEFTRGQLRTLQAKHKIPSDRIDKILATPDTPWYVEEQQLLDEEMGINRPATGSSKVLDIYRIHELTVDWQLDDNEPPAMLTLWWHQNSNTILQIFNPEDFTKPYEVARFIKRGRQFLASGMAEAERVLNLGANAIFNQTVDAQTIANASGFTYKADSRAADFLANSGVFPGVRIPVDEDVNKEFGTFELGSGGTPASIGLMDVILSLSEMIGKVGPAQRGQVDVGSRVSASVGLGVIQEGAQLRDSVVANGRDMRERAMIRTLILYARHNPAVFDEALPREDANELLAAIQDPASEFPHRVRISLKIQSAAANKEKDKQDLIVLSNFLVNLASRITENGLLVASPQAPQEAKQIVTLLYRGVLTVVNRLITKFDQFADADSALDPEIIRIMEQLSGLAEPDATGAPDTVFPRVGQPPVPGAPIEPVSAAGGVTGQRPRAAADAESIIAGLGGGRT